MNLNCGDFIVSKYSKFPGLIISKEENRYLTSINEYNGDYKWIYKDDAKEIKLKPCEELSILSNFGDWFYESHSSIYQEIIIKNLNNYFL
jgi:hypothetical protein